MLHCYDFLTNLQRDCYVLLPHEGSQDYSLKCTCEMFNTPFKQEVSSETETYAGFSLEPSSFNPLTSDAKIESRICEQLDEPHWDE